MKTPFKQYLSQGKSNNYIDSENNGKLKAGEAAALLTKKFKTKIYAKELHVFSSEWHHAGVFMGTKGKLTGRHVYFFTPEDVEKVTMEAILKNRAVKADNEARAEEPVQGWYVDFKRGERTSYGKRHWMPLLGVYKGTRGKAPKKLEPLNDIEYAAAALLAGKRLKSYAKYYTEIATEEDAAAASAKKSPVKKKVSTIDKKAAGHPVSPASPRKP